MKKILLGLPLFALAVSGALTLTSCGEGKERVALLIGEDTYKDNSYQQGTYDAFVSYFNSKGYKEYNDYRIFVIDQKNPTIEAMVENAVKWGAKGIICNGYQFSEVVYDAQTKYSNVKFMLHDSVPIKDNKELISENTLSITYNEHEAGYVASYISALDGYKNFGYLGGISDDIAVVKFGIGYVAGVYKARSYLKDNDIKIENYDYIGSYDINKGAKEKADSMYDKGAEVIFAAAGHANIDVIKSAEENNKKVIGVDIDQANLSPNVLTSATKYFEKSIEEFGNRFLGTWDGGKKIELGLDKFAVGLPLVESSWRFKNTTLNDYENFVLNFTNNEGFVPKTYDELKSYVEELGFELTLSRKVIEGK